MIIRRPPAVLIALASTAIGLVAAVHYHLLHLTLSHYDARGHLVVARRILDSISPGWQQIGAVWLPLPHLLNALPVQLDLFYRTGASGVAISVAAYAVAAASIYTIVRVLSRSTAAAIGAAALFALNPNVLYLQSTPMTEPLLLGLTTLAIALLVNRDDARNEGASLATISVVFALACLTRYEAWPVTFLAIVAAGWVRWRADSGGEAVLRDVAALARYPVFAVLGFMLFSRIVIGEWFVSGGFFVPENRAQGLPLAAIEEIIWGVRELSGYGLTAAAVVGLAALAVMMLVSRSRAAAAIPLALFATAALPWVAFLDGHPYRIRYMVPLIAAQAVAAGVVLGLTRRAAPIAAAALLVLALVERPPFDSRAAMVVEAQWDRPNVAARQPVSDYLRSAYRGETVMASMGSLGHYMQELSSSGFEIRDFLHEGNGDIWLKALEGPRPFVGWILIEEQAEGGDMLAKIARENPRFLEGFSRVSEGAGVALYARQNRMLNVAR